MEVVYSKVKSVKDDSLYTQNDSSIDKCNFENREQNYRDKNNYLLYNNNNAKLKEFSNPEIKLIDETEDMKITEEDLLVNTNNKIINNKSLVNISQKYSEDNNINQKYFKKKMGKENRLSATQMATYENSEFWTKQVPKIHNNGDYYRNIADSHINFKNRDIENFVQDFRIDSDNSDYLGTSYYNKEYKTLNKKKNFLEPKVSVNYEVNYSKNNNKITHSGIANNNKRKYSNQNEIYNKNVKEFGQIEYYNEGWLNKFNDEFKLGQINYNIKDSNNNNYDKYVCSEKNLQEKKIPECNSEGAYKSRIENFKYNNIEKGDNIVIQKEKQNDFKKIKNCGQYLPVKENVYNCKLEARTPYEKNILINRNEIMLASLNNKENQYRRKGFLY